MNLNHKHQLIAATLMLFSIPALAEWNKDMSVEYLMGDGDNRASARQAALEVLKVKASAEVGTYVQTTTILHDTGNLTENIQTLGASMVKLSNVHDTLSVNQGGQAVLRVTARAAVDDSELSKRIEALRQDKDKAQQLTVLQKENELLRHDLEEIHNALSAKTNAANIAELISRQNETIQRLSENSQSITQVFEPGALLRMVPRTYAEELNHLKSELDEKLIAAILKTRVETGIRSVVEDKDGYMVDINVWWDIDKRELEDSRYFTASVIPALWHNNNKSIALLSQNNRNGNGKSVFSTALYDYLSSKYILMELIIAGKRATLPVLYASPDSDCNKNLIASPASPGRVQAICLFIRPKYGYNNELIPHQFIEIHLSKDEAALATHVEAHFVMK